MGSEILELLVKANLAAGLAVVVIVALRRPLRALVGPRVGYGLWLAAPLAVLGSFLPARHIAPAVLPALPLDTASRAAIDWVLQPAPAIAPAASAPIDPTTLVLALWAAGATAAIVVVLWLQERSLTRLGGLAPEPGEHRLYNAGNTGFGPAVIGALRPIIVVPADFKARFNERERVVVLAHEQVHLARSDARINALIVLMQCLNWFNPLVHLAARLVRIDQELACDAAVMARYPEARRSYAEAMLKTQLAQAPLPLGCYWPARSVNPLKERLAMLKLAPPSRLRRRLGTSAIAALGLAAGYAAWTAAPAMAQAPAAAQSAVKAAAQTAAQNVGSALGAPTQARTATPAPTAPSVKAGVGGGPNDPVPAAPAEAAPAQRFTVPGMSGRPLDEPPPLPSPITPELAQALQSVASRARTTTIDPNTPIIQHGRIVSVDWAAGKSVFTFIDENKKVWAFTMASDADLASIGLDHNTAVPGTEIVVTGHTEVDVSTCGNACVGEATVMGTNGSRFVVQPRESVMRQQPGSAASLHP